VLSASVAAKAVPQDPMPITHGHLKDVTLDGTGPASKGWCFILTSQRLKYDWRIIGVALVAPPTGPVMSFLFFSCRLKCISDAKVQCCDAEEFVEKWEKLKN
jgi:hypothetical protein